MAELSEADRYLLRQIRAGESEGWSRLVERYQGRLLAFARARLPRRRADAEDLVQDTFAAFLQSLARFRDDASLETYLFTILRRKIIDQLRGRAMRVCSINEGPEQPGGAADDSGARVDPPPDERGHTGSWYAAREEETDALEAALARSLRAVTDRLRASESFLDLKVLEMLFYAQMRNKDVAAAAGIDEKRVAMVKFRWLKEIRDGLARNGAAATTTTTTTTGELPDQPDSLLTRVWERERPTCLKRSTVGRFLLGTLEPTWRDYAEFHLNRLGCRFCLANVEDVRGQSADEPSALRTRIFQSTVGFLSRP